MKGWKFGMILVEVCERTGEEVCELVELYALDNENEYGMRCRGSMKMEPLHTKLMKK